MNSANIRYEYEGASGKLKIIAVEGPGWDIPDPDLPEMSSVQTQDRDLEEVADSIESTYLESGAEIIKKETVQTAQDLPAVLLELSFEVDGDAFAASTLIYLSDGGTSVIIQYVFQPDQFEAGKELAYYSFGTFLVN